MGKVDWIWLFLKPTGRLTRWPYFLASTLVTLASSFFIYRHLLANPPINSADPWSTPGLYEIAATLIIATAWPLFCLSAKRAQDLGLPPLVGAIPVIFSPAYILLLLVPGKDEPNAYGPRRNQPPR